LKNNLKCNYILDYTIYNINIIDYTIYNVNLKNNLKCKSYFELCNL